MIEGGIVIENGEERECLERDNAAGTEWHFNWGWKKTQNALDGCLLRLELELP